MESPERVGEGRRGTGLGSPEKSGFVLRMLSSVSPTVPQSPMLPSERINRAISLLRAGGGFVCFVVEAESHMQMAGWPLALALQTLLIRPFTPGQRLVFS